MNDLGKLQQHFGTRWFTLLEATVILGGNPTISTIKAAKVIYQAAVDDLIEATEFYRGWKYTVYYLGNSGNKFRFKSELGGLE